jgi:hypothetical protein
VLFKLYDTGSDKKLNTRRRITGMTLLRTLIGVLQS